MRALAQRGRVIAQRPRPDVRLRQGARVSLTVILFFGMRYHPDMYLDVKFLAFAQAVET
jgi:hypothetical protein